MELVTLPVGSGVAIVDIEPAIPVIVWIGDDPGDWPVPAEPWLARVTPPSSLDAPRPMSVLALGDPGVRPGLAGHAIGHAWAPRAGAFTSVSRHRLPPPGQDEWPEMRPAVHTSATDGVARIECAITGGEVLTVGLRVINQGEAPLVITRLMPSVPLPEDAAEVLGFDGRWVREFHPRRQAWLGGTLSVDQRRGTTSHDRVPLVFVGRPGFSEQHGVVTGVHLAWSGNSEVRLDATADGRRVLQAGELLEPGEIVLERDQTHAAPDLLLAWSDRGITGASQAFHRAARRHTPDSPRPVLLNTWEAVYFDHDGDRLRALADVAASVGVERFVLDDGWFGSRRGDRSGLGDWWVSPDAHPDGLGPLIEHVHGLGMDFGIWVEPEMVNPDSDLFRAHPDWVLGDPTVTGRHQLVLDLTIGDCWTHLFSALDALLSDHDIAFVKWDHNRDLVDVGSAGQTRALHGLLDALRMAHPDVEFESCASGGGRIDHGMLPRVDRFWTSDCNDALERQTIQRGFSHFLPPEVMGAHIGPPRAHTTGRTQRLHFRAATAVFGHLGIEWNLLDADEASRDKVRRWVALHKELRPLLHSGDVVRLDHPDPAVRAHGVVAADRSEAVFSYSLLTTSAATTPRRLVLAGLDPDRAYRLEHLATPGEVLGLGLPPAWMEESVLVTGRSLQTVGLQPPLLHPESALLFRLSS